MNPFLPSRHHHVTKSIINKKQKLPTSPPLPKETNKEKLLDFTSHHHHVTNSIHFLPPAKNKTPPPKKTRRKTFREIGLSFPSSCDKFHQLPPQPLSKTPQKNHKEKLLDSELGYNSKAVREPTNSSH
jgi:hypothetical protein